MAYPSSTERYGWASSEEYSERGSKRERVFRFMKAANDLRQTYAAQWSQKARQESYDDYSSDSARDAFTDADIARSGDEEMVIFPVFASRHTKTSKASDRESHDMPGTQEYIERPHSPGDLDYWKREWEKYEDDNAILDVEVRGWIYIPQRGPINRKHRLLIALARKLCGIQAPGTSTGAASSVPQYSSNVDIENKLEEEEATKQAQSIIRKAEQDADAAWRESHPEGPREGADLAPSPSNLSADKDELSVANARLMERLRPFMANPVVGTPVTMFFFNNEKSQSRTTMTNDAGHFILRVALDFVPTHVRVLASESLSIVEEIRITEPNGITVISDIDDTIKHSAINSGAKEIFRNTFIRDLASLTIEGVREWYSTLANMGVDFHYVSNSPWQVYPLLKMYFKLAGLPPGCMHLKQYSGMLQGIFEPTAERKKGALDKILRDLPERKFILIGDSGEVDLEVYTDLALANPGRVLGIFIRDVTTPSKKDFFDPSFESQGSSRPYQRFESNEKRADTPENRPALPPRKAVDSNLQVSRSNNASESGDLISFSDTEEEVSSSKKPRPRKPSKPSALRTKSSENTADLGVGRPGETSSKLDPIHRKPAPPLPSKPRELSNQNGKSSGTERLLPIRPSLTQASQSGTNDTQTGQGQFESYTTTLKNTVSSAYNRLPAGLGTTSTNVALNKLGASSSKAPPPVPPPRRSNTASSSNTLSSQTSASQGPTLSYPSTVKYAFDRLQQPTSYSSTVTRASASTPALGTVNRRSTFDTDSSDYDSDLAYHDPSSQTLEPLPNKREEAWRRRWQQAQRILDKNGVVLGRWRVGSDVQDITVWLIKEAQGKMSDAQKNHDKSSTN